MSVNGPAKDVTVKGMELHFDMVSEGLPQVFSPGSTFHVGGKSLTLASLQQEVDARRTLYKRIRELRSELRSLTRQKRERRRDNGSFLKDVKIAVTGALGRGNPELARLGFVVERPRTPLTSEQKAVAAARARATREARHTLGPRQKETITGDVGAVKLVREGSSVHAVAVESVGIPPPPPPSPTASGGAGPSLDTT
jgi:hypothetical protein